MQITDYRLQTERLQKTDNRPQTTDHILQITDYRSQTTDHRPHSTDYRLQITDYRVQTKDHRPQTTDHILQITDYRSQTTDHILQITDYRPQSTDHILQITDHRSQTTGHRLRIKDDRFTESSDRRRTAGGALRLDGLCDGADLVDLEQQTVACLLLHRLLDALWVGHRQVITHHLETQYIYRYIDIDIHEHPSDGMRSIRTYLYVYSCGEVGPVGPVVLVEGILNRLD